MSKLDRLKAEFGFYEKLFFAGFAAFIALLAWIVTNVNTYPFWVILAAGVLWYCNAAAMLWVFRKIQQLLKEAEEC